MPLLSVGLPVYNGEKWLLDAVESVLEQSFTDFELIIADNASTDSTLSLCESMAARDSRIRFYRNERNIGVYRNWDYVFKLSSTKYFKWAAVSDFCLDGFFEKCVGVLESRPEVVLAYPRAIVLVNGPNGEEVAYEYDDNLNLEYERPSDRYSTYLERERLNNVVHGVIRSAALRETALHCPPLWGADISMVAELSVRGKFVEVPERLFVRRFNEQTSSVMMNKAMAAHMAMPAGTSLGQRISLHSHRFMAIARAPIGVGEKFRAWLYLVRRLARLRHQVLRKLRRLLR